MKTLIPVLILLPAVLAAADSSDSLHNISNILSKDEFVKIACAILEKCDRETYSQKYNSNPHISIDGVEFYLDPVSQKINFWPEHLSYDVGDYNRITVRDEKARETGFVYSFIYLGADGNVYTDNVYGYRDGEAYRKAIEDRYIPMLKSLIQEEKPPSV